MSPTCGISNHKGIYLSGDVDGAERAAYAYRTAPGGAIECITGSPDEVLPVFKADRQQDRARLERRDLADVFVPAIMGVALVVLMALLGGQLSYTLGMLVFVVAAYFPLQSMIVALHDCGDQSANFQQFRRNHGAEHALMGCCRKNRHVARASYTVQDLAHSSYLDPECGTIWLGTGLIFALVLGVAVAFGPAWGLTRTLLTLVVAAAVLVANVLLNPLNPLKLIQRAEVSRPTAYEMETALAAYNAFCGEEPSGPQGN